MATKITKSELKEMIREALREELSARKALTEAKGPNSKLVYVLTTFRGKTLIYDDFYDAVADAEDNLAMEANMIDTMYQLPDGTFAEVPESNPDYHRWTEEEGIIT